MIGNYKTSIILWLKVRNRKTSLSVPIANVIEYEMCEDCKKKLIYVSIYFTNVTYNRDVTKPKYYIVYSYYTTSVPHFPSNSIASSLEREQKYSISSGNRTHKLSDLQTHVWASAPRLASPRYFYY